MDNQMMFMHNMEKFVVSLQESSGSSHSSKQWVCFILLFFLEKKGESR